MIHGLYVHVQLHCGEWNSVTNVEMDIISECINIIALKGQEFKVFWLQEFLSIIEFARAFINKLTDISV